MKIRDLQSYAGQWSKAYRTKRERKPEFLFAHLHEEVSEAWKAWRERDLVTHVDVVTKHGVQIPKPEGLGAELADAAILIAVIADEFDLDLDLEIQVKIEYLEARLNAKKEKKRAKRG